MAAASPCSGQPMRARSAARPVQVPATAIRGGTLTLPGGSVVAVTTWTTGAQGRNCGVLTQGVMLAPGARLDRCHAVGLGAPREWFTTP